MPLFSLSWTGYQYLLYTWIAVAVIVFFVLFKITAPYGRHASAKWGPQVSNNLGWILMELPVLIVLWSLLLSCIDKVLTPSWVMIALFCLHYVYRSMLFPFRLHTKGKKMPLLIVGSGIFFNLMNGFSLGYYFTHFADYTHDWFTDPRFITGVVVFFAGMYINRKADNILIGLRKPGETGYKIPSGWLFEKISCPNLFGEMVEWLGFAILCWNLPALTFFIWTAANLIPRALSHHRWYRQHFTDYPAKRRAVIPFYI